MNKRAAVERIKVWLIALLSVSAAVMLWRLADYSDISIFHLSAEESAAAADDSARGYAQCAKPLVAAVTGAGGERFGVRYDETAVEELYARYSAALAEALGSAGAPEAAGLDEWERALSGEGVYFDFVYAQPLGALSAWLGAGVNNEAAEHRAARLCLSIVDNAVLLYYIREDTGEVCRCNTLATLNTESAAAAANGAVFVFETGISDGIDPYTLICGADIRLPTYTAAVPAGLESGGAELMSVFGLNSFIALTYTEPDGTAVYVDGGATLRLSPNGTAAFRQGEGSAISVDMGSEADIIDSAYRLADRATSPYRGACSLMLSSAEYSEQENEWHISFQYVMNGLVVLLPELRAAAEITVAGGYITGCEIFLRTYSESGESAVPLPEKQAFAMISASGGGEPLLCFADDGNEAKPGWVAFER